MHYIRLDATFILVLFGLGFLDCGQYGSSGFPSEDALLQLHVHSQNHLFRGLGSRDRYWNPIDADWSCRSLNR